MPAIKHSESATASDNPQLHAEFSVEREDGQLAIYVESGDGRGRNPDYKARLYRIVERLASVSARIDEITVESRRTAELPSDDKRLEMPEFPFPIRLGLATDPVKLRFAIGRAQEPAGQAEGTKGNRTKRIRIAVVPSPTYSDRSPAEWRAFLDGHGWPDNDGHAAALPGYLLTWNPGKSAWPDRAEWAAAAAEGRSEVHRWSCGNTASIRAGARVFMLQQGSGERGLVGFGVVEEGSYKSEHWNGSGELANNVDVRFHSLLGPGESPLNVSSFATGPLSQIHWQPFASGVSISPEAADILAAVWTAFYAGATASSVPDEVFSALEGEKRRRMVTHVRRERALRSEKVREFKAEHHGRLFCEVPGCGFDFERVYGPLGTDYAQVHHLHPLAEREQASLTLLTDLAVVCANCHVMIHHRGECRALDSLIPPRGIRAAG